MKELAKLRLRIVVWGYPMQTTQQIDASLSMVYIPSVEISSDEWFAKVVEANRDFRIERTAEGDLVILSPTGGDSGALNSLINARLFLWAEKDGSGQTFDSSTGFRLPNSAIRSPDASWVTKIRLAQLSDEEKRGYLPLAPDFVIELRSQSDSVAMLQTKMTEYIENGTHLGWLIDPLQKRVYVYRGGDEVATLEQPSTVSGDTTLPGFILDLTAVW